MWMRKIWAILWYQNLKKSWGKSGGQKVIWSSTLNMALLSGIYAARCRIVHLFAHAILHIYDWTLFWLLLQIKCLPESYKYHMQNWHLLYLLMYYYFLDIRHAELNCLLAAQLLGSIQHGDSDRMLQPSNFSSLAQGCRGWINLVVACSSAEWWYNMELNLMPALMI